MSETSCLRKLRIAGRMRGCYIYGFGTIGKGHKLHVIWHSGMTHCGRTGDLPKQRIIAARQDLICGMCLKRGLFFEDLEEC